MSISHLNIVLKFYLNQQAVYWVVSLTDLKVSGMLDLVHLIKYMRQVSCLFVIMPRKYGVLKIFNAEKNIQNRAMRYYLVHKFAPIAGVIARLSGLQCHNVHGINLYGVIVITLMVNLHAGEQSSLRHLSLLHRYAGWPGLAGHSIQKAYEW